MKKTLKNFLCCLCLALICSVYLLDCLSVSVYCLEEFVPPEGYEIYETVDNIDGSKTYYCIDSNIINGYKIEINDYNSKNDDLSMSPQMTYPLWSVENSDNAEINSIESLVANIAVEKNINIEDVTTDMLKSYLFKIYDKSSILSNSFSYNGYRTDNAYCSFAFENDGSICSYISYFAYDLVGANDWYAFLHNMLGWSLVNSVEDLNYNSDYKTFVLYDYDSNDFDTHQDFYIGRWHDSHVTVGEEYIVQFQSLGQTIFSSGCAIFDMALSQSNVKMTAPQLLESLFGGSFMDVLRYSDYKSVHSGEEENISYNYPSPCENIKLENNTLYIDIPENYPFKVGYYVDYLVNYYNNDRYRLFRHYFYEDEYVTWNINSNNQLVLNSNSLETSLPCTDNSLDGTKDNTIVLGVGFFGYKLNDDVDYSVSCYAPTRTKGLGDIKFITNYDYYTFSYPTSHKDEITYYNDWNENTIEDVDVKAFTVYPDSEIVEDDDKDKTITYTYTFTINDDDKQTDSDTYVGYDSDGKTIIYNITNNTNTYNTIINNSTTLTDEEKQIILDYNKNKSNDSNNNNDEVLDDNNYFNIWKQWIQDCREFIGSAPEFLSVLWSWLPKELQAFIVLSLATGFGVGVIRIILGKE